MRWFLLALLLTLCSCAQKIGPFVPGLPPEPATRIPQGSTLITPDGKKYELCTDAVVVPEGYWNFVVCAMALLQDQINKPEMKERKGENF